MAEQQSFLGTGWGFPPAFDRSLGVLMVSDVDDIRESLIILLSTEKGERFLNPEYGCALQKFVFEEITTNFETNLKNEVYRAIMQFEPRVILENVDINIDESVDGVVYISLDYIVRSLNVKENLVYPFYIAPEASLSNQTT